MPLRFTESKNKNVPAHPRVGSRRLFLQGVRLCSGCVLPRDAAGLPETPVTGSLLSSSLLILASNG